MNWDDVEDLLIEQMEHHNICCCGDCEKSRELLKIIRGKHD